MAFDVSALANYTKENEALLVTSSVLGSKTASLIKAQGGVMVGVKSSEKINILDTDAIFQAGGTCGFTASGSTSFTQRSVTVGKIKVMESLCPKSLESKYLQKSLPEGSRYDSIAFAADYTDKKAARIAAQLETALWTGDTASVNVNLNKFDGLVKLIGTSAVEANNTTYYGTPATSITAANVIAIVDALYKAIPAQVVAKDDTTIFLSQDVFRTYTIALKNANMFNYSFDGKADSEFVLPGTSIKVVATPGLNGVSKLYAMRLSNLFLGTDLLNEEEKFELFYSKDQDEMRMVVEFKMGVNVAFLDEVASFII